MFAATPPSPAAIVREWSADLNADRNEAAARLFAPNAVVVQFPYVVRLRTHALAVGFNASLPCAGRIVGISVKGEVATAVFVLGRRPHHRCDGPGQKAAARFRVHNGKIVRWEQIPVPANVGKPTA
jgi:limonene-1,2-epoxide hydrolase